METDGKIERESNTKKAVLVTVCAFVLVSIVVIFLSIRFNAKEMVPSVPNNDETSTPAQEFNGIGYTKVDGETIELLEEQYTGVVVMLGSDNTYIRVQDESGALSSVGINADTIIMQDGALADSGALVPRATIRITGLPLPDSELYDILATSIDLDSPGELHNERRAPVSRMGAESSLNF